MKLLIDIDKTEDVEFDFDYEKVASECIKETLKLNDFPEKVSVSLSIVSDSKIEELNTDYRGINNATDVLSFPMYDFKVPGDVNSIDGFYDGDTEMLLGDIVISMDRIVAQANEYGHSIIREFAFLIVHSTLHLIGYDHIDLDDAHKMEKIQKSVLDAVGIKRE